MRLFLFFFLGLSVCCQGLSASSYFAKKRKKIQTERSKIATTYLELKKKSEKKYSKKLQGLLDKCLESGLHELANTILAELERIAPGYSKIAALKKQLAEIKKSEDKTNETARKQYKRSFGACKKEYVQGFIGFTNKLIKHRLFSFADQNIQEILACDSDNKVVRKYIGQRYNKKTKTWMSSYVYKRYQGGEVWDNKLGWMQYAKKEKYETGLYPEKKKWVSLKILNEKHKNLENPWKIETEHFEVWASTDLELGAQAAFELENLYKLWIRNFAGFFEKKAGERLFNKKSYPRFKVYFFDSEKLYLDWVDKKFNGDKLLKESVGFFSSSQRASQFYFRHSWKRTLFHEVTHQIFGETSAGHSKETSLIEGLAVYIENGKIESGELKLRLFDNKKIVKYKKKLLSATRPSFSKMLALDKDTFHGDERRLNYAQAGTLVFFMMQTENGLYAPDFLDYVIDSYKMGKPQHKIHEYLGLTKEVLNNKYKNWLKKNLDFKEKPNVPPGR